MKRYKQIFVAFLLIFSLATIMTSTGCAYGQQCQATKVGNHKAR